MAPAPPDARSQSNAVPLLRYSAQVAVVAYLTVYIVRNIRRAARSLGPTTGTRAQEPVRRRNVAIFSTLALLSLISVTTFGVAWRVLSYFEWAEHHQHDSPNALWSGWYGTGDEGLGHWRLGDWWSDIDHPTDTDRVTVASPEGLWYTGQHLVGLATAAMFMGIEGRRRNLSNRLIAAFVFLSGVSSLGFALNLFFVTMLFTPFAIHDDSSPRHNALFTPEPAAFYIPSLLSLLVVNYLPTLFTHNENIKFLRLGYFAMPLTLAFGPQLVPAIFGHVYTTKTAAHRSFVRAFHLLGITSLLLQWRMFFTAVLVNTPQESWRITKYAHKAAGWTADHTPELLKNATDKVAEYTPQVVADVWAPFQDLVKKQQTNRFVQGLGITASKLQFVSRHPAISVLASDVAFTIVGLLVWTFIRQLEVSDILENSILSYWAPKRDEKHVAFQEQIDAVKEKLEDAVDSTPIVSPKKRGRPKKNAPEIDHASSSPRAGTLRRSTRRRAKSVDSDADSTYEPPPSTRKAVEEIETDGAPLEEDFVAGGESTALAVLLWFVGGLGQLAAAALGAEVTRAE